MQIVDLTPEVLASDTFQSTANSFARNFYGHYATFWAGTSFEILSLSAKETSERKSLLLRNLAAADEQLLNHGFSTRHLRAIFCVGNGTANGHAFLDQEGPAAWFAIECFRTELETKVFTMHELIHALHYGLNPEFAFDTMEQKNLVSRQLITEGIATYLTKRLWDLTDEEALWADALPSSQINSWMAACRNSERELFEFVRLHFDSSDSSIELFYAANPEDIFSYRAGYYVGWKLIEFIANEHNISDREFLTIPATRMQQLARNAIRKVKK